MKKIRYFYVVLALYIALLVEWTGSLIQLGVSQHDMTWWLFWVLINCWFIGRVSVFIESANQQNKKKTPTKAKRKTNKKSK